MKYSIRLHSDDIYHSIDITGHRSIIELAPESKMAKWLNDRMIFYDIVEIRHPDEQILTFDSDPDTFTEFVLVWGDVICVD
jgi:hypothetical protein